MPKLKICGITNLPDARYVAAAGADFLGFIRYDQSPRYVEAVACRQIIEWLSGAEPVGVYVNTPPAVINAEAAQIGFTWIQLSGDETPEDCVKIQYPVIKGLRITNTDTLDSVRERMETYEPYVQYFLLDTYRKGVYGGTGETFNWAFAAELAKSFPVLLAGGLSAENIREAIETTQPTGADLSSRLEETPGVKDFDKLDAFFTEWKALTLVQ